MAEHSPGLRILVVGINYAPEHTGIAPYTSQASTYLAGRGHSVCVLAGVPHYPHWTVPEPYRRRRMVVEHRDGVEVRRLRHHVPSRQTALTRGLYEFTYGTHVLIERLPWRPDVVLGVIPSLLGGGAAAALIAARTRTPLVLWVQDLMAAASAQSGIAGGGRVAALTARAESWALKRASRVVIVSSAFTEPVASLGADPARVVHVPNWSHLTSAADHRGRMREVLGWRPDEVIALHTGNMGLKQGLENVVDAARRVAPDERLRFVLVGDGSQRASLESLAATVPAATVRGPVASDDYADLLAAADVLLVNERGSAIEMSLPSKLTSYFAAGGPVVAAVPAGGGTAAEVMRSGGGVVVPPEDPAALLEAVRALAQDPEARRRLGAAGRQHAEQHLSPEASLGLLERVLIDAASNSRGAEGRPARRRGARP